MSRKEVDSLAKFSFSDKLDLMRLKVSLDTSIMDIIVKIL